MKEIISFGDFLQRMKSKDANDFILETVKQRQSPSLLTYLIKERTFEQWFTLSFIWENTELKFDYWNNLMHLYFNFYKINTQNETTITPENIIESKESNSS